MNTYPNQKVITTHRQNVLNGDKQYLAIACETLSAAARNLNGNAFKLYLYLACNRDNYEKAFSPKDFAALYKVSAGRARTSLQELIDKGYVVDNGKNHYDFYEEPQITTSTEKLSEAMKKEYKPEIREVVIGNKKYRVTYNQMLAAAPTEEAARKTWEQGTIIREEK